jgi:hypothetical protein
MDVIARIKERQDSLKLATRNVITRVAERIDVDGCQTVPNFSLEQ